MKKKIHGFSWIRRPRPPWFCLAQAWVRQNQRKKVKRATNWAIGTLVKNSPKLEFNSIFAYNSLNKGSKIHYWPIYSDFLRIGPMPSWSFWKNATFHIKHFWALIGSSRSILAKLGLIWRFLDQIYDCLQILQWFMPKFLRIATNLHVNT